MKTIIICLIAWIGFAGCWMPAQEDSALPGLDSGSILSRIVAMGGIVAQPLGIDPLKRETFELQIQQPLDHSEPEGKSFTQRAILTHRGFDRPTVLIVEGYALGKNYLAELARLLDANEVRVEHRYFGLSRPQCMCWNELTLKQAVADYHDIVGKLKKIYTGPWVCGGWSKGGQTAMVYRLFFPDDVAATVAYDAPLNFSQEDPRIDAFFEKVGTPECREKLKAFQRIALENRDQILPLLSQYSFDSGWYCPLGLESAFEFAVLEYPFSFWQYTNADCTKIPGAKAAPKEIFQSLRDVSGLNAYGARAFDSPASWQFFSELGYYGFVTDQLKDLLKTHPRPFANRLFAPKQKNLAFDPKVMRDLDEWIRSKGDGMIYIYGDNDPWAATRIESIGTCDALKMVLPKGNHFTFIESFPTPQQQEMLLALKRWMGLVPKQ